MSCVIGLLNEGKIYLASDGIATTDDGERRPIVATKIYKNGPYLMGFTGSVRTGQLVSPDMFKPPDEIIKLPDAMREHLYERGSMIVSSETQQHLHSCNFIIGFEGSLFEILIDFQLNEIYGDYTTIGSGAPFAMGALFATRRWNSPEKRLMTALKAACEYDRSCGKPFTIEVME